MKRTLKFENATWISIFFILSIPKVALFPPISEDESISGDLVRGHFPGDKILSEFSSSAVCTGESVHVFVDPKNGNRPVPIPESWKVQLRKLKS